MVALSVFLAEFSQELQDFDLCVKASDLDDTLASCSCQGKLSVDNPKDCSTENQEELVGMTQFALVVTCIWTQVSICGSLTGYWGAEAELTAEREWRNRQNAIPRIPGRAIAGMAVPAQGAHIAYAEPIQVVQVSAEPPAGYPVANPNQQQPYQQQPYQQQPYQQQPYNQQQPEGPGMSAPQQGAPYGGRAGGGQIYQGTVVGMPVAAGGGGGGGAPAGAAPGKRPPPPPRRSGNSPTSPPMRSRSSSNSSGNAPHSRPPKPTKPWDKSQVGSRIENL